MSAPRFTCIQVAEAAGLTPATVRGKEYLYHCPRHDDRHPSLSINPEKDVWMCGPCGKSGTPWQFVAFVTGLDPGDKKAILAWLKEHGVIEQQNADHNNGARGRIVATYPYVDESGN